jgi:NAD(P)H-nitrite reductase large subunit
MALVCLCTGTSERKVVKAIDHGARTVDEVGAACRAGTRCGGCRPTIEHLVAQRTDPLVVVAPVAVTPVRLAVS